MKSFIESQFVEFDHPDYKPGYVIHHFAFAAKSDEKALAAMERLIESGVINPRDVTENPDNGFLFSWYTGLVEKA